jgi:hypothetical protein
MASKILIALGAVTAWLAFSYASRLRSNILKARRSNLPYLVTRE